MARQLGLRFVDSDTEIDTSVGMPIRDWFPLHGGSSATSSRRSSTN
ncbi:MAG: shikimate kinase [Rubrivivax sp.]